MKTSTAVPAFEIRKHKHCEGREGIAYSGELWINGERAASFTNAGNGGMTDYHFFNSTLQAVLNSHVESLPWDLDMFIADLCDKEEQTRRIKRNCRTKTVFQLLNDPDGVFSVRVKYSAPIKEQLQNRHGANLGVIYNEQFNIPPL